MRRHRCRPLHRSRDSANRHRGITAVEMLWGDAKTGGRIVRCPRVVRDLSYRAKVRAMSGSRRDLSDRSHRWRDDNTQDHWRRDDYVSKSIDRGSFTCGSRCSECGNRLPNGLHQVRQGRRNLLVHGHAFSGLWKVRYVRLCDADRADHLPGFVVPVDQCR